MFYFVSSGTWNRNSVGVCTCAGHGRQWRAVRCQCEAVEDRGVETRCHCQHSQLSLSVSDATWRQRGVTVDRHRHIRHRHIDVSFTACHVTLNQRCSSLSCMSSLWFLRHCLQCCNAPYSSAVIEFLTIGLQYTAVQSQWVVSLPGLCNASVTFFPLLSSSSSSFLTIAWGKEISEIYTVSQKKTIQYNIVHNFTKCWPIFKILSLTDSLVNVQENRH